MLNQSVNNGGIYRAFLIATDDDIRIYIPGLFNDIGQCPINSNGTLNSEIYQISKHAYPTALWCLPNIEAKQHDEIHPCWVVFENGDITRPTIMGFLGKGIKYSAGESNGASDTAGDNNDDSSSNNSTTNNGVDNYSQLLDKDASTVAQSAVTLACQIANDDKHQYVYGGKGPTNFDCSGFVWYCFNNSNGGNLSKLSYAVTSAMKSTYTSAGFKDITGNIDLSSGKGLITGDILLNVAGGHVDIYAGGGKRVGAHSSKTGIYIDNYGYNQKGYNDKYDCILRYSG